MRRLLFARRYALRLAVDIGNEVAVVVGAAVIFLDECRDRLDLVVNDQSTLRTARLERAYRRIKHIALAYQLFGACDVDYRTAVYLRRDRKRNTRRHVCLDKTRDYIDRRALRAYDKVDARGTRLLRKTAYRGLDLIRCGHHEVGKLVDDYHDLGQRRMLRGLLP